MYASDSNQPSGGGIWLRFCIGELISSTFFLTLSNGFQEQKKSRNNGYVICSSLENKKASKKVLENGQHWFVASGRCVSTMPVVAFLNKVYAPILEKNASEGTSIVGYL